jgi:hypothetical protein
MSDNHIDPDLGVEVFILAAIGGDGGGEAVTGSVELVE